jgi:hypothetical protein
MKGGEPVRNDQRELSLYKKTRKVAWKPTL